jgi:hypothetical protein
MRLSNYVSYGLLPLTRIVVRCVIVVCEKIRCENIVLLREYCSVFREDRSVLREDRSVLREDRSVLREDRSVLRESLDYRSRCLARRLLAGSRLATEYFTIPIGEFRES